jgi:hypothetical protein
MFGEPKWELLEGTTEQPWIRLLRDCLAQNQQAARRYLGHLMMAGLVSPLNRDLWRLILVAPPKWPRTS